MNRTSRAHRKPSRWSIGIRLSADTVDFLKVALPLVITEVILVGMLLGWNGLKAVASALF